MALQTKALAPAFDPQNPHNEGENGCIAGLLRGLREGDTRHSLWPQSWPRNHRRSCSALSAGSCAQLLSSALVSGPRAHRRAKCMACYRGS